MQITDAEAMASLCRHNTELKQCIRDMQKELKDKDIELHIDRETLLQEYMPRAEFEARLKADKLAMLNELQLEIEESENCGKAFHLGLQMASNIIQQKINALKENEDGIH